MSPEVGRHVGDSRALKRKQTYGHSKMIDHVLASDKLIVPKHTMNTPRFYCCNMDTNSTIKSITRPI